MGACCGKKARKKKESKGAEPGGTKKILGGKRKKTKEETVGVKGIYSKQEFQTVLKAAGDSLIVVDFYATWCGPCKMVKPKLEEMAIGMQNDKVVFLKVDVDQTEELSGEYGISSMPTFILIKNSEKVEEMTGTNMGKLKELIETNK